MPADLRPPARAPRGPRRARVLVADDEPDVRRAVRHVLSGHDVVEAEDGAAAIARIESDPPFDLVLTDLQMPRVSGVEVVRAAVKAGAPVIMITGTGTTETAVQVMRLGAVNYITKPFEPDALGRAITDVLAARDVLLARRDDVVGSDPRFRSVLEQVEVVADTQATVLLTGETGTGKDVIARFIHRLSGRRSGAFVTASMASQPAGSIEHELFGHAGRVPGRRGRPAGAHPGGPRGHALPR